MQATTQLTAADIHWIVQALGAHNIAEAELDNLLGRYHSGELTEWLTEHAPTHVAVVEALNPDGSIRDQAAFDALWVTAGQETGR